MSDCPLSMIEDMSQKKGAGASYWKLEDQSQVGRAIAAYIATQKSIVGVTYTFVEFKALQDTGVSIKKSLSSTPDVGLNDTAHHDVIFTRVSQVQALLGSAKNNIQTVTQSDVKKYLIKSIQDKLIPLGKIQDPPLASLARLIFARSFSVLPYD